MKLTAILFRFASTDYLKEKFVPELDDNHFFCLVQQLAFRDIFETYNFLVFDHF